MPEKLSDVFLALDEGDEITVTVDNNDYRGTVTRWRYSEAERHGIDVHAGSINVELELTKETTRAHGLPSSRVKIHVPERLPNSFDRPTAKYYDPDKEAPRAATKYVELGPVETVDVHSA